MAYPVNTYMVYMFDIQVMDMNEKGDEVDYVDLVYNVNMWT